MVKQEEVSPRGYHVFQSVSSSCFTMGWAQGTDVVLSPGSVSGPPELRTGSPAWHWSLVSLQWLKGTNGHRSSPGPCFLITSVLWAEFVPLETSATEMKLHHGGIWPNTFFFSSVLLKSVKHCCNYLYFPNYSEQFHFWCCFQERWREVCLLIFFYREL